jgi:transcriptional regulator with XRE-family HTH domain
VPADTFANRLLLARRMNGLTIKQAAALIADGDESDVASSWSNWENGRRPRDAPETIRLIAAALDVDQEWLMFGGPLSPSAPPRRVPKRSADTRTPYVRRAGRPTDTRPNGRPTTGQRPGVPPRPEQRRPVRISGPSAA